MFLNLRTKEKMTKTIAYKPSKKQLILLNKVRDFLLKNRISIEGDRFVMYDDDTSLQVDRLDTTLSYQIEIANHETIVSKSVYTTS